jgi:hypothetical protein
MFSMSVFVMILNILLEMSSLGSFFLEIEIKSLRLKAFPMVIDGEQEKLADSSITSIPRGDIENPSFY